MSLVLLPFDVEQREETRESGAGCHSLWTTFTRAGNSHTDKQSAIRVGKLSVGWGSVPAWKKEREDRIWILLPVSVDLLHHGRRSRGRGRNPVLTNSELYLTTPYLWLLCITIPYSMCMIVHVIHSILYALEFRFWMNVNHEKSLFDVCGNPEHYTFYIVKVDPILTAFSCSFNGCFWMNVEWHDQVCGFAAIVVYLYMVQSVQRLDCHCLKRDFTLGTVHRRQHTKYSGQGEDMWV